MSGTYSTRHRTCKTPQICNVRHISTNTEANHKGAHGSKGERGVEKEKDGMGWGGRGSVGEGRYEGIESASCESESFSPPPSLTVGVASRRGTLVDSGGSGAARARGLTRSLVLAVERASPRSALGTQGARRVPPTCGGPQQRRTCWTDPPRFIFFLFRFHETRSSALRRNRAHDRFEMSALKCSLWIRCERDVLNADGGQVGIFSAERSGTVRVFCFLFSLHSIQPREPREKK